LPRSTQILALARGLIGCAARRQGKIAAAVAELKARGGAVPGARAEIFGSG